MTNKLFSLKAEGKREAVKKNLLRTKINPSSQKPIDSLSKELLSNIRSDKIFSMDEFLNIYNLSYPEDAIKHSIRLVDFCNYANRSIIGGKVGSQPFVEENKSGIDSRAGFPHYLLRFVAKCNTAINTTAFGVNLDLLNELKLL